MLTISNAAPSGSHPWHLYEGKCGDNGVVVGSASAYPPLNVNQQGTATAAATLPLELPTTGMHYVAVNASAANMETVVACGTLHHRILSSEPAASTGGAARVTWP